MDVKRITILIGFVRVESKLRGGKPNFVACWSKLVLRRKCGVFFRYSNVSVNIYTRRSDFSCILF